MSRETFEDGAISRYDYLLNDFINLAINRFTWDNLPLGLTSEQMEFLLISKGQLMFFEDNMQGYYILPSYPTSDLNVYGVATKYVVMSENGKYNKTIDIEKGVLIKNNPLASADIPTLETFAKRIDDIEMTQDVNLFQQCIPKIILADEDSKLTAKALINKVRQFKFAIFGKKSLVNNITSSDVLDTTSPYILDKLQQQKYDLKNELLTYLGINNNNNVKKERMIVDEVNANNEYTSINLDLMFDLRERACKEINEKFGFNIKVKKREVKVDDTENYNTRGDSGE